MIAGTVVQHFQGKKKKTKPNAPAARRVFIFCKIFKRAHSAFLPVTPRPLRDSGMTATWGRNSAVDTKSFGPRGLRIPSSDSRANGQPANPFGRPAVFRPRPGKDVRGVCSPQCRTASAIGNVRTSMKPDAGGVVSATFSPAPQRGARLRLSPTLHTHTPHTYIDKCRRAFVASLERRQGKARIPTVELRRVSRRGRTQLPAFSCSAPGAEPCAPRRPLAAPRIAADRFGR